MNKKAYDEVGKFFSEIEKFFLDKGADSVVVFEAADTWTIKLKKYDTSIGGLVSFANMNWVSELLGTDQINLENEYSKNGCDTCNWGAMSEVDMVCLHVKLDKK